MKSFLQSHIFIACCVMAIFLPVPSALAQDFAARGLAEYVAVEDSSQIQHGHILILEEGGYRLATIPYDERIIGVASLAPSVAISSIGKDNAVPLVTSGSAQMLVIGSVQVGDYVTSSSEPGVGQHATAAGYVVGRALSSFESTVENDRGIVTVEVNPRFAWSASINARLEGLLTNPGETLAILPRPIRYAMATIVMLVAIVCGYLIYNRMSSSTVAAIGRNPLASRTIIVLAGLQSTVIVGLVIAGFMVAYFILIY